MPKFVIRSAPTEKHRQYTRCVSHGATLAHSRLLLPPPRTLQGSLSQRHPVVVVGHGKSAAELGTKLKLIFAHDGQVGLEYERRLATERVHLA